MTFNIPAFVEMLSQKNFWNYESHISITFGRKLKLCELAIAIFAWSSLLHHINHPLSLSEKSQTIFASISDENDHLARIHINFKFIFTDSRVYNTTDDQSERKSPVIPLTVPHSYCEWNMDDECLSSWVSISTLAIAIFTHFNVGKDRISVSQKCVIGQFNVW
jgi:hypothetical protein